MKALLVICAVLAVAVADESCCSEEDRREVQNFWGGIWGAQFSGRRIIIAQQVFKTLFDANPGVKDLFKRVNVDDLESAEFKAHCVRVINGLDVAINLLDDPDSLHKQLDHLATQHKAREGVRKAFFPEIGKAFFNVMPRGVPCFNPEAWNSCFNYIANSISNDLP